MKNGLFKNFVAAILSLTLILSLSTTVFATGGTQSTGTIPGVGTPVEIIFEVDLPTDLNFGINPFGIGDDLNITTSRIRGANYGMVNHTTESAVMVVFSLSTAVADDVSFYATQGEILTAGSGYVAGKNLYFEAVGAASFTATSGEIATAGDIRALADEIVYNRTTAATVVNLNESNSTPGQIAFLLDKYVATTGDLNVASFTFYGELDTIAPSAPNVWKANDIRVSGAYTLIPVGAADYAGNTYGTLVGKNQVEATNIPAMAQSGAAGFVGTQPAGATLTADGKTLMQDVSRTNPGGERIVANFYAGDGKDVTHIVVRSPNNWAVPATDWTYDPVARTITFTAGRFTSMATNQINFSFLYEIFVDNAAEPGVAPALTDVATAYMRFNIVN